MGHDPSLPRQHIQFSLSSSTLKSFENRGDPATEVEAVDPVALIAEMTMKMAILEEEVMHAA